MNLNDFDYDLPGELIATAPATPRDHSRLLCVNRASNALSHHRFYELEALLRPNDVLVVNNTKVFPARLYGTDASGRRFEIFLLESLDPKLQTWKCLAKPGKKIKESLSLSLEDGSAALIRRLGDSDWSVQLSCPTPSQFYEWLNQVGKPPLPPYIKRAAETTDVSSYQTVYARDSGSIAAPTAGLHFTRPLLDQLKRKGIRILELTLHVGYGTFSPIRATNLADHTMHEERYEISEEIFSEIQRAKREGRRVIAVGTTSLRALESIERWGLEGKTALFIRPGFQFKWVDGLVTNFHLPRSSLYVLVSALLGPEQARRCYEEAIRERYRFYSYGDAMLIV